MTCGFGSCATSSAVTCITHEVVSPDTVKVGTNVEYAPFVEFGTVFRRAKPYLRPAFDEEKGNAVEIFRQQLEELLSK